MAAKRSSLRVSLRLALLTVAVVGFGVSIYYAHRLSELRKAHSDLRKRAGLLEIDDPSKVSITRVPVPNDMIPPGVDKAHVWQFRIYIPANYGPCYTTRNGLVKADSPQGRGGQGSNWSGTQPEPEETLASMALLKSRGKWMFCRTSGGGSSSTVLPDDFDLESLDHLAVETVAGEGEKRVFDTDEAVCLFRLRENELATKRNGETETDLYRGMVVYLYSRTHQDAFDAWATGKASSMKEAVQ